MADAHKIGAHHGVLLIGLGQLFTALSDLREKKKTLEKSAGERHLKAKIAKEMSEQARQLAEPKREPAGTAPEPAPALAAPAPEPAPAPERAAEPQPSAVEPAGAAEAPPPLPAPVSATAGTAEAPPPLPAPELAAEVSPPEPAQEFAEEVPLPEPAPEFAEEVPPLPVPAVAVEPPPVALVLPVEHPPVPAEVGPPVPDLFAAAREVAAPGAARVVVPAAPAVEVGPKHLVLTFPGLSAGGLGGTSALVPRLRAVPGVRRVDVRMEDGVTIRLTTRAAPDPELLRAVATTLRAARPGAVNRSPEPSGSRAGSVRTGSPVPASP
jgi:hypothetical protein